MGTSATRKKELWQRWYSNPKNVTAHRARAKKWRKDNPEKENATKARWRAKNADKILAWQRKRYANNTASIQQKL